MVYYGTEKAELIYFHEKGNENNMHFIVMEQDCDESVFYVRTCCNSDWEWKFYYNPSNYEMVKHMIMDAGFECDAMDEMLFELDGIFEEIFEEIVVWDECECNRSCEHCDCKE